MRAGVITSKALSYVSGPSLRMLMTEPEAPTFDAKSLLATLTDLPGVYRMVDGADNVLYVCLLYTSRCV